MRYSIMYYLFRSIRGMEQVEHTEQDSRIMSMLFRLFLSFHGTEQNKVDVFADRYVCSAAVIGDSGQSQFASLKLRSLALVPYSWA